MTMKKSFITVAFSIITLPIFANAPVVDLNQASPNDNIYADNQPVVSQAPSADSSDYRPIDTSGMSPQQRLNRLEQQMNNFAQMNTAGRMEQLQQQVQQLQGQLEMQSHQLQALQDQQKTFYQDINQRLAATSKNPVAPNSAATPTITSATNSNDENAYQGAFTLLTNKKYDQAAAALQNYAKQFPNGKYLSNAHYWLGEIYFMQSKVDSAAQEFQTVIMQFPKDKKVPDAMFKLAVIHDTAGNHAQARTELRQIMKQYPGTSAAQLASLRLKTIAQE